MSDKILLILANSPYIGLFFLLILGGVGLPIPEDITLIICGFLIYEDVVDFLPAISVVYAGLLLGDALIYLIGRKLGRMIVTHRWFHNIISPERLLILEDKFKKRGVLLILIGRQMLVFRSQIFLVAGVMRMSFLKFLITDAIASVFTITSMVGIGFLGARSLQIMLKNIKHIEHTIFFIFLIALVIFILYRSFRPSNGKKQGDRKEHA